MRRSDRVRLDEAVALRPERFGALGYSYRDRQLFFIDGRLLPFIDSDGARPLGDIADELVAGGALEESAVPRLLTVLEGLRRRGVVHVVV
ncbi:MAG TPA: mycofactocin biosynthesis chaperone MftB [Candidatus Dormibacteraeota bacterium]|nr:mycofactocin biosynthesis chaperone MftB [Candidatus Dormibacteraeota bacterium]